MKKRLFALLLAGLLICVGLMSPFRDALGFGDFDSSSDYGGSSDSDYGSSSGSDSNYWDSDRSSSGSSGSGGIPWRFVPVLGIIYFVFAMLGGGNSGGSNQDSSSDSENKPGAHGPSSPSQNPWQMGDFSAEAIEQLRQEDPDFSDLAFKSYVRKLFEEMQSGWEAGDISNVRYGFLTDTWERFNTQLQMKNTRGEVTHVSDIYFERVEMTSFKLFELAHRYETTVVFEVYYNVWVTRNGVNIQGSPSTRHRMIYRWKMERQQGVKPVKDPHHCPNCGAELDVAAFAECPFCHTPITQKAANWQIRDIEALQQTIIHQ